MKTMNVSKYRIGRNPNYGIMKKISDSSNGCSEGIAQRTSAYRESAVLIADTDKKDCVCLL